MTEGIKVHLFNRSHEAGLRTDNPSSPLPHASRFIGRWSNQHPGIPSATFADESVRKCKPSSILCADPSSHKFGGEAGPSWLPTIPLRLHHVLYRSLSRPARRPDEGLFLSPSSKRPRATGKAGMELQTLARQDRLSADYSLSRLRFRPRVPRRLCHPVNPTNPGEHPLTGFSRNPLSRARQAPRLGSLPLN